MPVCPRKIFLNYPKLERTSATGCHPIPNFHFPIRKYCDFQILTYLNTSSTLNKKNGHPYLSASMCASLAILFIFCILQFTHHRLMPHEYDGSNSKNMGLSKGTPNIKILFYQKELQWFWFIPVIYEDNLLKQNCIGGIFRKVMYVTSSPRCKKPVFKEMAIMSYAQNSTILGTIYDAIRWSGLSFCDETILFARMIL